MILVCDLDDTLYEELTYVKSSFFAVSRYLSEKVNVNINVIYNDLIDVLSRDGRGKVFNDILKKYGIFSKKEVHKCLSVYRYNYPDIKLYPEAEQCLRRFSSIKKYLVTDGNKLVQRKKIEALNLDKYFKKSIPTHNYGIKHAKPSTYVFHKILEKEKAKPYNLVYVGDNPNKDFVNLKKEGFGTIRVLTGYFRNHTVSPEYEADYVINTLDELTLDLLYKLTTK